MVVPVSEVPGGSGSACRDTLGEIQLQRLVGAFLEFDCRKYERCIACVFEIVDHELVRAICVMLCVAGLILDVIGFAVRVVRPRATCGENRLEIVEDMGMKADALARCEL